MSDVLKKYQEFTKTTAIYPLDRAMEYLVLGLTSEAGEVSGKLKKEIRDGSINISDFIAELGDCMWYISEICNQLDVDLEQLLITNMEKLTERKKNNTIKGSGDHR